jgi:hypothetical protein
MMNVYRKRIEGRHRKRKNVRDRVITFSRELERAKKTKGVN